MTSPFPDDKHTQEAMALAAENKDRELWCEREGDYYADCIFVTEQGSIGINCGGAVVTKSVRDWFALGAASLVHDDTNPSDDFGKARPGERQPRLESLLSPPPAAASEIEAMARETTRKIRDLYRYGWSEEEDTAVAGFVLHALTAASAAMEKKAAGLEHGLSSVHAEYTLCRKLLMDRVAELQAAEQSLATARAEVEKLQKLVYVPGLHKCAKCGCGMISTNLHAQDGSFSANNKPQDCPNGCGPMWPVTERQAGNEAIDRGEALSDRALKAEAEVESLKGVLAEAERHRDGRDDFIVSRGLWMDFVASLGSARTAAKDKGDSR